ncbi:TIGR04086 family membrane protein [Bacillus sp. FJAT-27916]|uniref:TIGR04086 family membrane protein n=1 Tax=Bacillus sp. FJAT-27916 TaxID=1679169 RepID=UPI002F42B639
MIPIESRNLGSAILYGVVTIFIMAAVFSLFFSLILRFTNVAESSLTYIIMILSFLTLFIGGFIAGGKGKKQGWLLGGGTGLIYTLIVFLYQYLGLDALFTSKQLIYNACFIVTAMMGGVLGVNLSGGPEMKKT